jgi:hypothetical protein
MALSIFQCYASSFFKDLFSFMQWHKRKVIAKQLFTSRQGVSGNQNKASYSLEYCLTSGEQNKEGNTVKLIQKLI